MADRQTGETESAKQSANEIEIGEITRFLREWSAGNKDSLQIMFEKTFKKLRSAAHEQYARTRGHGADQATELVGFVWERLNRMKKVPDFGDSKRFYAYCGRIMRNLLIDRIRQEKDLVPIDIIVDSSVLRDKGSMSPEDQILVIELISRMEQEMPKLYEVYNRKKELEWQDVQTADALGISIATVQSRFALAKTWLKQQMENPIPGKIE